MVATGRSSQISTAAVLLNLATTAVGTKFRSPAAKAVSHDCVNLVYGTSYPGRGTATKFKP